MAITQGQVGVAIAGGSVGITGAELMQHAVHRGLLSPTRAQFLIGASSAATLTVASVTALGVGPLSLDTAAFLAGVGVGKSSWYEARNRGLAPKLTIDIPETVNLAQPLVSATTLAIVGTTATTVFSLMG